MKKTTKTQQVKERLEQVGSITSWEAINLFGATRLSAIIFNLRDRGMNIKTYDIKEVDRNGNTVVFGKYVYVKPKNTKK